MVRETREILDQELQPEEEKAFVLTKRITHEQQFVLRRCTRRDLPAIMLIQHRVRRKVGSRSLYVMTPRHQVAESLKKDFTGSKKVKINKASVAEKVLSKLEAGKKYYVRIRAWKKAGGKKYQSAWSPVKTKKTK